MVEWDYLYDDEFRRNLKWKTLYAQNSNRIVYEGYTFNNKPCGLGTSFDKDGNKFQEGIFDIKGLVQGKEYYSNGQVRFEGTLGINRGRGSNYPLNGNYYDEDGILKYSGPFKTRFRGNCFVYLIIEVPKDFGGWSGHGLGIDYLYEHDIEDFKKEPKVERAYDESKYPLTYEEFEDKILEIFVEEDMEYPVKFSSGEKREFVMTHDFDFHEAYNEECEKYDEGKANLFEDTEKDIPMIQDLLFDCDVYYTSKELANETTLISDLDENAYPMTYQLFKEKMIRSLVKMSKRISKMSKDEVIEELKPFFKENPNYLAHIYRDKCQDFDRYTSKNCKFIAKKVFDDQKFPVFDWGQDLDFWFFM